MAFFGPGPLVERVRLHQPTPLWSGVGPEVETSILRKVKCLLVTEVIVCTRS